jgi:effector-binding domain-containing protein
VEYDIRCQQLAGRPLAVVRRRARPEELSKVVPEACGAVWNFIRSHQISGAGRHVAVYLDGQINLEVGVELDGPFSGSLEVVGSSTPAGLVAMTTHHGPYGLLNKAHEAILHWCGENGLTLAGPNWEIYGHWQDGGNGDPTKICTEVFYLLTPNGRLNQASSGPAVAAADLGS